MRSLRSWTRDFWKAFARFSPSTSSSLGISLEWSFIDEQLGTEIPGDLPRPDRSANLSSQRLPRRARQPSGHARRSGGGCTSPSTGEVEVPEPNAVGEVNRSGTNWLGCLARVLEQPLDPRLEVLTHRRIAKDRTRRQPRQPRHLIRRRARVRRGLCDRRLFAPRSDLVPPSSL